MRFLKKDAQAGFEKLRSAIQLLATADPVRFARMQRDVTCVAYFPLVKALGEHWPGVRTCILNVFYCQRPTTSVAEIAGVLVHEATHARLRNAGFVTTEANIRRIEQICVNSELRFAARLNGVPNAVRVKKNAARRSKHLVTHPQAYTAAAQFERGLEGMRQQGMPAWMVRLVARRHPFRRPTPPA